MRKLIGLMVCVAFLGLPGSATATATPAIVGGTLVTAPGSWPWMVTLLIYSDGEASECSGSLIGPTTVLTAAHCVYPVSGVQQVVVTPSRSIGFNSNPITIPPPSETVGPSALVPDPLWRPSNVTSNTDADDVAIVKLSAPLSGTSYLPVLQPDQLGPFSGFFDALTAGYGITSGNLEDAGTLYQKEVTGVRIDPTYPFEVDSSGTCEGDSGGPLIVPTWGGTLPVTIDPTVTNGDWAVIGVTDTGPVTCDAATLDASVASYASFLLPYEEPVDYSPPSVSGDPAVGSQLSCDPGTWSVAADFTYSWETVGAGGATAISGAHEQTYTPQGTDAGSELECQVQAAATGFGSPNTATSAPVGPVAATVTNGDYCGTAPAGTAPPASGPEILPFTGVSEPEGVAVDAAGDVFVAGDAEVVERLAGGGQVTLPITGLIAPNALAVDAAGDVFVVDSDNDDVVELPAGGAQRTLPFTGLSDPESVAVDAAGDVFVANQGKGDVVELTAGGTQVTLPFTGLSEPYAVAVDARGDVFVGDAGHVVELPVGAAQRTLPFSATGGPYALAVDAAGDVFATAHSAAGYIVVELPAGGGQVTLPISGLNKSYGLAVDTSGDLFFADTNGGLVAEVPAGSGPTVISTSLPSPPQPVIESSALCGSLSGAGQSGADISVAAGTPVSDQGLLSGPNAGAAIGTVTYNVYSDEACSDLVSAGTAQAITAAGSLPASPSRTLSTPGTYYWQAVYSGDALNEASTSPCGSQVETVVPLVKPGALIVSEARLTGPPGQPDDCYVDVFNASSSAVSLSGWSLLEQYGDGQSASVALTNSVLDGDVSLAPGQHYLVGTPDYSLASVAAEDEDLGLATGSGGLEGVALQAPGGAVSDSVGYAGTTYALGTGLIRPVYPTGVTSEIAFVRRYSAGAPVDTGDNTADFVLVAPDAATAGYGQNTVLGSPSPSNSGSPSQVNAIAQSYLLDPTVGEGAAPNEVYTPPTNVQPVSASNPGTLLIRRTITNVSGSDGLAPMTITRLQIRITGLSTYGEQSDPVFGDPAAPGDAALLADAGEPAASVENSAGTSSLPVAATTLNPPGSGLNSTLSVTLPLQTGSGTAVGLVPGQSVNVAIAFNVYHGGPFSFAYNVEDDLEPYQPPASVTTTTSTTSASAPVAPAAPLAPAAVSGVITPTQVTLSSPVTGAANKTVTAATTTTTPKHTTPKTKAKPAKKPKKHAKAAHHTKGTPRTTKKKHSPARRHQPTHTSSARRA